MSIIDFRGGSIPIMIMMKKQALTLIEVMIAIIIFGTGILVVMSTMTSNIGRLYDIKEKDQAVTLAKEGIDMIYHIRDSNLERGQFWNCGSIVDIGTDPNRCGPKFYIPADGTEKIFMIQSDIDGTYTLSEYNSALPDPHLQTQLYLHQSTELISGELMPIFWYDHESTYSAVNGAPQDFYRTVEFRPVGGTYDKMDSSAVIIPDDGDYSDHDDVILEVTSRVIYQRRSDTDYKEVVLQSIIGNIR